MSMRAVKIEPDAGISVVEITGESIEQQNDSIYKHLGGYFDVVRMGRDACMLVDDGDEFCDAPERFIKLAAELNGAAAVWEEEQA